jgi:hypothetical protein
MSEASGLFQKACPEPVEEFVQSCPEPCRRKGRSRFCARSVLPVHEHGKLVTCLRRAYSAEVASATKAGSRYGRLRAKAGFSGEREGRERRWRLFSTAPEEFLDFFFFTVAIDFCSQWDILCSHKLAFDEKK